MKIAYIGRISFKMLEQQFRFDHPLPQTPCGFGLGAAFVLGLLTRGHEVVVIDGRWGMERVEKFSGEEWVGDRRRELGDRGNALSLYLVPERKFKWQMLTLYRNEVRAMRAVLDEVKPDVVFAQWTYQYAYAGLTSGYPTLVVAHDSPWTVARTFRNIYGIFHAFYAQFFVFPKLKHVTAVSPHIVDDLKKLNGFKGYIPVIPNGIEVKSKGEISPEAKPSLRRKSLEGCERRKVIRQNAKTIVCVSQAGRLKNTQALIKAFEMLKVKHSDWRLIMYGQGLGVRRQEIGGIEMRGLASREEIDWVLCEEADVFCSPSLEESFGMVFVEAMRQGVPCVGGEKSGAVPWVLGDSGVVCDVTKPEKLSDTIERIMINYDLRKKLSEGGMKRVREIFDIEKVMDRYEKELARVAIEGNKGKTD